MNNHDYMSASKNTSSDVSKSDAIAGTRAHRPIILYLIPSLMTTGALFGGFVAIVAGIHNNFELAAAAIYLSLLLDIFDGRVARLTNTSTAFGAEYDSLSDMVAFGVAPSLVMFNWALDSLGQIGWAVAFAYIACSALRLARFNTQVKTTDKRFFAGLASPLAAAVLAGTLWVGQGFAESTELSVLAAVVTAFMSLLMVSNFRYQSFKGTRIQDRIPAVVVFILALAAAIITLNLPLVLLSLAIVYASSGPLAWLWSRISRAAESETA